MPLTLEIYFRHLPNRRTALKIMSLYGYKVTGAWLLLFLHRDYRLISSTTLLNSSNMYNFIIFKFIYNNILLWKNSCISWPWTAQTSSHSCQIFRRTYISLCFHLMTSYMPLCLKNVVGKSIYSQEGLLQQNL